MNPQASASEEMRTVSFVKPFIDELITYIDEEYIQTGADLSRLAIVFGGKRPSLFVKRELSKRLGANFYPPQFFTIDEFMAYTARKAGGFTPVGDLDSCYLLYTLAREHCPQITEGRESFAQFLPWTREILKFINNLDLEHIPDEKLKNVESNAQIGFDVPDDINRLLEHVVILRNTYKAALEEQKRYSRGQQYFKAAEVVKGASFEEFDKVIFCNFFYFNRSEEIVVSELRERGLASMIFQGDDRKWPVLSRIADKFKCTLREGHTPDPTNFDLKLYSGFDTHSQAGVVREILKSVPKDEQERTVVVLPEPDHLIPLVTEVSQVAEEFNVSMGYPLKRSSLYSLMEFIFRAQMSRQGDRYYARDYLKVLSHPFTKSLDFDGKAQALKTLVHTVQDALTGRHATPISGSLFITLKDIESCAEVFDLAVESLQASDGEMTAKELVALLKEVHALTFTAFEDITTFRNFGQRTASLLDVLAQKSFMREYPLNMNIATKMYGIIDEFVHSTFSNEPFAFDELVRIFDGKVAGELVAFQGSPLKGLQVLGLQETRSLNFDHVIILDVNEGALPRLNIYEPLIPREVMISLNLDRLELEEEIQRYQFMRLISSAKNVHLIYQESREKERSRFVEELIWEEQKVTKAVGDERIRQAAFNVSIGVKQRRAKKTPEMIEMLKKHRYSASSLNMYLRNPMEFYENYVLGLREAEDLLDEPEARHLGIFVHDLLEEAYRPFVGGKLKINAAFRKSFDKLFEQRFADTFGKSMRGDAFLMHAVLKERLKRFVDHEEEARAPIVDEIMYLEERFKGTVDVSAGKVEFGYIVDRVERLTDGTIMIIDYKTGGSDIMPKDVTDIASMELSRENIRDTVKSFQMPLYFQYLHDKFPDEHINAALYNLRTMDLKSFINPKVKASREDIISAFNRSLDFIISEILDPSIDFVEDLSD